MKIIQLALAAAIVPAPAWAQLQAVKSPGAQSLQSRKLESKGGKCQSKSFKSKSKSKKKLVDCADMPSSVENIAAHLLGNDPGSSFQGSVLDAGDAEYEESRKQYATAVVPTFPTYIVRALSAVDVQAAVTFAAKCEYSVTTRSGGHSYLGISSCDGSPESPCIQVDVGGLNSTEAIELPGGQGKQLRIGPGVILNDIAEVFVQEEVFVPTGECSTIAMGGHMQTGGFGPWGRSFGTFAHHVASFDIVLADGSLVPVERPRAGATDKLNDDLFFAVLGGASGSFGTVVELTLDANDVRDYFSFYWEVYFVWNDDTLPGIKNMLRKYAEIAGDPAFQDDPRWNVWWNPAGYKKLLQLNPEWPDAFAFNTIQLDLSWVVPKGPGVEERDELSEARAFYDALAGACTGCVLLDDFLPAPLLALFPSAYAVSDPMSLIHRDITIFQWERLNIDEVPYKSSFTQGANFPTADAWEEMLDGIDGIFPKADDDFRFVISQLVTIPGPRFKDPGIALPFQDDIFGAVLDVWDFTGTADYGPYQRSFQDNVTAAQGGVEHRMFWAAYEEPCLECGDWVQYYETEDKYERLREIKTCVDPNNVFDSRMSVPPKDAVFY